MLGVIIGVSAVIIMVSIVEGARFQIVKEFERLGSKLIVVIYQPRGEEIRKGGRLLAGLDMDDVRAIERQCDLVENVTAESEFSANKISFGATEMEGAHVSGVQPAYRIVRNAPLARGRFVTDEDLETWNKVCVIGDKVRAELFKKEDPIGKQIEVSRVNMTVVGVLEKKGSSGPDSNADSIILIPITTLQKRLSGSQQVSAVFTQPKNTAMLEPAMDQIWQCLMRRHDNAPGFRVDSSENILKTIGRILTIFSLVLGSIAGLSLLVGGIGIMNIMLVSVTERTREIGVRKAVGAKRRDILLQFLIEAATVSGFGGLAGIGIGAGIAWVIHLVTKQFLPGNGPGGEAGLPFHLPLWAILGAFLFSAFIGMFFGIYPAARAASLQPVDALRHE
jgi:putative ABC transport system permease protein